MRRILQREKFAVRRVCANEVLCQRHWLIMSHTKFCKEHYIGTSLKSFPICTLYILLLLATSTVLLPVQMAEEREGGGGGEKGSGSSDTSDGEVRDATEEEKKKE